MRLSPKHIQLGYANYSRNAANVKIESYSPLKGSYTHRQNLMGTFESAVTAINDVFSNYLLPAASGLTATNGYRLYTDQQANADYLFNPTNGIFMSLDTPRTVFAKAQYVRKHKLGGIFTWMADQDEGLMLNAAREGLGYQAQTKKIEMDKIINTCGSNISQQETCRKLTHLTSEQAP
ncbi:glycosyl hydrolase family 18 protein [Endozoicomonas montiporae]|nr:glycosyl hydrolase family 18 protein [Endozoicomonas montiporae]